MLAFWIKNHRVWFQNIDARSFSINLKELNKISLKLTLFQRKFNHSN